MLHLLLIHALAAVAATARSPLYGNCSVANNHLDANTKEFVTDCDSFGCWFPVFTSTLNLYQTANLYKIVQPTILAFLVYAGMPTNKTQTYQRNQAR